MDTTMDLKVLLPDQEITVNGNEVLIIKPFTFGRLPKVIKQAGAIINMFSSLPVSVFDEEGEIRLDDPAVLIILTTHMADSGENLVDILCLGTGKSREWVEDLSAGDGILLLMKVWEINKDFFTRQLLPKMQKFPKAKAQLQKTSDGDVSSSN